MDIDRDDPVKQLRDHGHRDKDAHKSLLDQIGIDDSIIDKLPGGLGDKKLKDIF
jgi:hypothetical protein